MNQRNPGPLKVLIVDDEMPARLRLRELLGDIAADCPNQVVAEAENGLVALHVVMQTPIDVVLVDIRMPGMDGIEFVQHLCKLAVRPAVIFTTAYDNYAIKAFELSALDYLLKPVRAQRLSGALLKAQPLALRDQTALAVLKTQSRTHLAYRERDRLLFLPVAEVLYLRAELKYVTVRTLEREYLIDESLSQLAHEFGDCFVRLHRSVLVARVALTGFIRNTETGSDTQWLALVKGVPDKLPVSRRQWPHVKRLAQAMA